MTASHYEIKTADASHYCDTSSDAQDVRDALEFRGIDYTAYVVFTDRTRAVMA
jgi:hypothetical protein